MSDLLGTIFKDTEHKNQAPSQKEEWSLQETPDNHHANEPFDEPSEIAEKQKDSYNKIKMISEEEALKAIENVPCTSYQQSGEQSKALSSLEVETNEATELNERNIRYFIIDDMKLVVTLDRAISKTERILQMNNYLELADKCIHHGLKLTNVQPKEHEMNMIVKQVLGFFDLLQNQDKIIIEMILSYLHLEEVTQVWSRLNKKLFSVCQDPSFLAQLQPARKEFDQEVQMFDEENVHPVTQLEQTAGTLTQPMEQTTSSITVKDLKAKEPVQILKSQDKTMHNHNSTGEFHLVDNDKDVMAMSREVDQSSFDSNIAVPEQPEEPEKLEQEVKVVPNQDIQQVIDRPSTISSKNDSKDNQPHLKDIVKQRANRQFRNSKTSMLVQHKTAAPLHDAQKSVSMIALAEMSKKLDQKKFVQRPVLPKKHSISKSSFKHSKSEVSRSPAKKSPERPPIKTVPRQSQENTVMKKTSSRESVTIPLSSNKDILEQDPYQPRLFVKPQDIHDNFCVPELEQFKELLNQDEGQSRQPQTT